MSIFIILKAKKNKTIEIDILPPMRVEEAFSCGFVSVKERLEDVKTRCGETSDDYLLFVELAKSLNLV